MSFHQTRYEVWKKGECVQALFRGDTRFRPGQLYPLIDPSRVVGVDTESFEHPAYRSPSNPKGLRTALVPVALPHPEDPRRSVSHLLETPNGTGMLEKLFALLIQHYGVPFAALEDAEQKTVTEERPTKIDEEWTTKLIQKHVRHVKLQPVILTFYNLEYDLGRLTADRRFAIVSMLSGAPAFRTPIGTRFILEIVRTHLAASTSSFEWVVIDKRRRMAMKLLATDVFGYWKSGLDKTASTLLGDKKDDIKDQIPDVFERPLTSFTPEEWAQIKEYAKKDADLTRRCYLKTCELLVQLSPAVVRKDGTIPQSMPGATAKMAWAESFDKHPEVVSIDKESCGWERPPAKAERLGARAYCGGNFFSVRPGVHRRMISVDLKSAYPNVEARLPDPVRLACVYPLVQRGKTAPRPFNVNEWKGKWGVLVIDGEGLDDLRPAIRKHDPRAGGRLRYIYGPFKNEAVTIPEAVIGVVSGRLRIDRVNDAVVMLEWRKHPITGEDEPGPPDPSNSFLRSFIAKMFAIKEDPKSTKPLKDLAKLSVVSLYGKKAEINDWSASLVQEAMGIPTYQFKDWEKVSRTLLRLFSESGLSRIDKDPDFYFGVPDTAPKAMALYKKQLRRIPRHRPAITRACRAIESYVNALDAAGEPREGTAQVPVRKYLARKSYRCGYYWSGLYASQITGMTSAMLGLMSSCLDALQGDTDSVHLPIPEGIEYDSIGALVRDPKDPGKDLYRQPDSIPGFDRYFTLMREAGYESTRLRIRENGSHYWEGGVEGCPGLGFWAVEIPPSEESVLVMIKCYSHQYIDKGKRKWKQAKHALPAVTSEISKLLSHKNSHVPVEERRELALMTDDNKLALKLLNNRKIDASERAELADATVRRSLHEGFKDMLTTGKIALPRKDSPVRLRQAIRTHREYGLFMRDLMSQRELTINPSQWKDAEGWVRWRRLDGTRAIDPLSANPYEPPPDPPRLPRARKPGPPKPPA